MSPAVAEALFSGEKTDSVFLSEALAADADKVLLGAPAFFKTEYGAPPEAGFVLDLLGAPAPPNVSKAAVFPVGIREKGKPDFVGVSHFILGYPTENTVFVGLLVVADAAQRKGFGKSFLEGLYTWARPQGINFVRVRAHPQNAAVKAFLDKNGFVDLPNRLSTGHEVWERKLPAVED